MKKIERPDWNKMGTFNDVTGKSRMLYSHRVKLNDWFDAYIEPINKMLEEAVEVSAYMSEETESLWYGCDHFIEKDTHKALLINIQPINKKRTAEDLLRDILKGEYTKRRDIDLIKDIEKVLNAKA